MQCVQGNKFKESNFWRTIKFSFSYFDRKHFGPLVNKLRQGCQKVILSVRGNVLRGSYFWRSIKLFINFVLWAKAFRTFGDQILAGLSKFKSTSPKEHLWKFYRERIHLFSSLSKNEWRTVKFWQKKFGRIVKIAIWVSRGTFW